MGWFGNKHIEGDGENGSHHQNFEHKIIEGANEKGDPLLRLWLLSEVVAKLLGSLREVNTSQTSLKIDFEGSGEAVNTCTQDEGNVSNSCNLPPN